MNSSPSSLPKQTSNLIKAKQGAKLKSNYKTTIQLNRFQSIVKTSIICIKLHRQAKIHYSYIQVDAITNDLDSN